MDEPLRRLQELHNEINRACERCGRDPATVTLVGAAKTVSPDRLRQFVDAGLVHVGENYVQEARTAREALGEVPVFWHGIGSLQSNKARAAIALFDLIHDVDRASLATALDREARAAGKVQEILLGVNLAGEPTKSGCAPADLPALLRYCRSLPGLVVRGLMCLPPYDVDPQKSCPWFRKLYALREANGPWPHGAELSMGMSHDFPIAIAEGATIIRVGTALFGSRPSPV